MNRFYSSKNSAFLGSLAVGAITATFIASAPAGAVSLVGSLEWTNGTSSFLEQVDADTFNTLNATFDVTFSDLGTFASDFSTGDFNPFFGTPPQAVGDVFEPVGPITFRNIELIDPPFPSGIEDEAVFRNDDVIVFRFDTATLPDGDDGVTGPVTATLANSTFLGELREDGAVELELADGEWVFDAPNEPGFDSTMAFSSVFEFGQDAGSPRGTYDASGSTRDMGKVPEPASILGLLAVGSLGMALKCKKQSYKIIKN